MEDVSGIPDVAGLENFVKANSEQPGEPEKTRDDKGRFVPQPQSQAELKRLKSFQNPDGTLNLENVDKSYGEIQGLATKTSQENKELKEQLAQMQEQMRLMQASYQHPAPPQTQAPDFDTQFINDPKKAIDNVVSQRVAETIRTLTVQEVLSREQMKNPDEFHERYGYAMRARQMYPNLVNSSAGVEMLFQLGDKMRESDLRRNANKFLKAAIGEDVDLEKFKTMIKKDQSTDPHANKQDLAYMPDSSGAFRTGPPSGNTVQSHDAAINDAVQKGDPDTVLQHLFRKKLSTT